MLHPMFCDLDKPMYLHRRTTSKRGSSEVGDRRHSNAAARSKPLGRTPHSLLMFSSPPAATPFSRLDGQANDPSGGGLASKSLVMYSLLMRTNMKSVWTPTNLWVRWCVLHLLYQSPSPCHRICYQDGTQIEEKSLLLNWTTAK